MSAEQALNALRNGEAEEARRLLEQAIEREPRRIDLMHALGVTLVQLGESVPAIGVLDRALAVADEERSDQAATLIPQLQLAKAAAFEDLDRPLDAEAAYQDVLKWQGSEPRAQSGLAHLLMASGRVKEGRELLKTYLEERLDQPEFIEAEEGFLAALDKFTGEDKDPQIFLEAHRGGYVDFFDETAERMESEGWIAEAAKMVRDESGQVVPLIPEGARPYAALRIDLVNPETAQPGQVGEDPMVVALQGYEALAQTAVVLQASKHWSFPVWVSSQSPWDQMPVQIQFRGDVPEQVDETLGSWYRSGFEGAFGSAERGRLHYISDPMFPRPHCVVYNVDLGRTELEAVRDLLARLEILHDQHPIQNVLLGRGHLPG